MNKKLITLMVVAFSMASIVFAQDPPALPTPPNQGPIGGMVWLAISGLLLAVKKYSGTNKK